MVHGDDRGLKLPPKVAPTQIVMIPIGPAAARERVIARVDELYAELKKAGFRVKVDDRSDVSPGWKFNEYEMRGVPLRIEIGPRDMDNGQAVLVSRVSGEKRPVSQDRIVEKVRLMLDEIQRQMYDDAKAFMESRFAAVDSLDELKAGMETMRGFYWAGWCGSDACEHQVKEETGATARNIPFEVPEHRTQCLVCGEKAKHTVVFARAY
jgi:prolyl-tRNA synthetase